LNLPLGVSERFSLDQRLCNRASPPELSPRLAREDYLEQY